MVKYKLEDLRSLLGQTPLNTPQFLFLLGTDTNYTEGPTINLEDPKLKKSYERGETLSYLAQLVAALYDKGIVPTVNQDKPHSFSSLSVDLLNGPTTLGTEVYDRITQALFLALKAAASGKTSLHISAHSRGAVIGILLMHEIARIKKALQNNPDNRSLYDIIVDSPCGKTKECIQESIADFQGPAGENDIKARASLLERLNNFKINAFLIDPVPGGSIFGINTIAAILPLPKLKWSDDRFYEPLPCDRYELLVCRDERTRCFRVIIPRGCIPTIIPGHHGSASGNRYNQQGEAVSSRISNQDTTTVQDLVLCKALYFYQIKQENSAINLKHPELDKVSSAFINAGEIDRARQIYEYYQRTFANNDAYISFVKKGYPYLGIENDNHERIIKHDKNKQRALSKLLPKMQGPFINIEHARLFLNVHLQLEQLTDASPASIVSTINQKLQDVINEMKQPTEPSSDFMRLITDPELSPQVFHALANMVDTVSQKFLRNHLNNEEKRELLSIIQAPFQTLKKELAQQGLSDAYRANLSKCKKTLEKGLCDTIKAYHQNLLRHEDEFEKKMSRDSKSMDSILGSLEELYKMTKDLEYALPKLSKSVTDSILIVDKKAFQYRSLCLIDAGARLLKEQNYDLSIKPETTSEQFFNRLKAQAIKLNAPSEIQKLQQLNQEQKQCIHDLQQQIQQDLQQQIQQKDRLINDLNSQKEDKYRILVHAKLMPLTQSYMKHLWAQAKRYNSTLQQLDLTNPLPELPETCSEAQKQAFKRIKDKFDAVKTLHDKLTKSDASFENKVDDFKQSIQDTEEKLKLHRNEGWKRYIKPCMAAIALVMTGAPGLALLLGYSFRTGRSPLFFNKTEGQNYLSDCKHHIKHPPTHTS